MVVPDFRDDPHSCIVLFKQQVLELTSLVRLSLRDRIGNTSVNNSKVCPFQGHAKIRDYKAKAVHKTEISGTAPE